MSDSRVERAAEALESWKTASYEIRAGRALEASGYSADLERAERAAVEQASQKAILAADLAAAEKALAAAQPKIEWQGQIGELSGQLEAAEKKIEQLLFVSETNDEAYLSQLEYEQKLRGAAEAGLKQAREALERIRDHGNTHEEPCYAIHNGDCADVFQEIARATLAALSSSGGERPAVKSFADIVNLSREFPCPKCHGRRVPCDLCNGYRVDPAKVDLPSGGEQT